MAGRAGVVTLRLLLVVCAIALVRGTPVLVAQRGNDSVGCGSLEKPCASISFAVKEQETHFNRDLLEVLVEPGKYEEPGFDIRGSLSLV